MSSRPVSLDYAYLTNEVIKMEVFNNLFSDLTGWLTIAIIVFMLVMMTYLFSLFISKSSKHK